LTGSVAVQCTYFDKSERSNWPVPLHQDLCITVQAKVVSPDLKGWSTKEGSIFVQPPASVLEQMTAVRVHLDDSADDNGPLRVVPGSHRSGCLRPEEQRQFSGSHGEVLCTTHKGGVVALKPLRLRASSRATSSRPRRVLHYVYGPQELPYELAWARAV
jgi:ectoine hydroxylase-related dioxygenase (phytanoyl-CoA dioxygenase family)